MHPINHVRPKKLSQARRVFAKFPVRALSSSKVFWAARLPSTARPCESCQKNKVQTRRFAVGELVPNWFKIFPSNHVPQSEINNSTTLRNRPAPHNLERRIRSLRVWRWLQDGEELRRFVTMPSASTPPPLVLFCFVYYNRHPASLSTSITAGTHTHGTQ